MTRRDDLVDKGRPIMWPFLFEYGDEDKIELIQECTLGSQVFFRARALYYAIDDEVADASYNIS